MTRRLQRRRIHLVLLAVGVLVLVWSTDGQAAGLFAGSDVEKPTPEFTRAGERISARLIPRAKSSSITIEFEVIAGGKLEAVRSIDFATVDRPEVDVKNFKSAVFEIGIRRVARSGKATVAIRSDFFTLSTAFYVFNPQRENPWIQDTQTENRVLADRVRELVVQVQDGGDLDADGQTDGRITLIGGPRDSFWGYALGTLFIRFFGIFIVLTILMIGMIVSGRVFKALDLRTGIESAGAADRTARPVDPSPAEAERIEPDRVSEETIAVIAAALYLRDKVKTASPPAETGMLWPLEGRKRIMNDRLMVFNQAGRIRPRRP